MQARRRNQQSRAGLGKPAVLAAWLLLVAGVLAWLLLFYDSPDPSLPNCTSPDGRYTAFLRFRSPRSYVIRPTALHINWLYGSDETLKLGSYVSCAWVDGRPLELTVSDDADLGTPNEYRTWAGYDVRIQRKDGTLVPSKIKG